MIEDKIYNISFSEKEIRYLISCGSALIQNIPKESLPTYCSMSKDEIIKLSLRLRDFANKNGIEM